MKSLILAASLISGCIGSENGTGANPVQHTHGFPENVSYMCVGMESSQRFGSCPGCEIDANSLDSLMKLFGYKGEVLISGQATKEAVVGKLKDGIERTSEDGLFLFFYSGHGGQEYLGGKEPDGSDGMDEYLCLYDTHMLDDEIWDIVSKCKGRVFLYFDACHSATMYRSVGKPVNPDVEVDVVVPKVGKALGFNDVENEDMVRSSGFTFRPYRFVKARAMESGDMKPLRMLCWSGCKESQYSYGGNRGGVMTSSLMKNWKSGISYSLLWGRTRQGVIKEQPTQTPVQTIIGDWPTMGAAFR